MTVHENKTVCSNLLGIQRVVGRTFQPNIFWDALVKTLSNKLASLSLIKYFMICQWAEENCLTRHEGPATTFSNGTATETTAASTAGYSRQLGSPPHSRSPSLSLTAGPCPAQNWWRCRRPYRDLRRDVVQPPERPRTPRISKEPGTLDAGQSDCLIQFKGLPWLSGRSRRIPAQTLLLLVFSGLVIQW